MEPLQFLEVAGEWAVATREAEWRSGATGSGDEFTTETWVALWGREGWHKPLRDINLTHLHAIFFLL